MGVAYPKKTGSEAVVQSLFTDAETYFSAEQSPARQNARVSEPHEDRRRTGRHLPPPRRRAQKADRQLREVAG